MRLPQSLTFVNDHMAAEATMIEVSKLRRTIKSRIKLTITRVAFIYLTDLMTVSSRLLSIPKIDDR